MTDNVIKESQNTYENSKDDPDDDHGNGCVSVVQVDQDRSAGGQGGSLNLVKAKAVVLYRSKIEFYETIGEQKEDQ